MHSEQAAQFTTYRSTPNLVEVKSTFWPPAGLGWGLAALFVASMVLHQYWWVAAVIAVAICVLWKAAELLLNRLHEPIVRLSPKNLQPGQPLIVECEVRAKRPALIRDVLVGFQSVETRGEDTHTEHYGSDSMAQPYQLGSEPAVVRYTVQPPGLPKYMW